ncbi:MAG: hypothetical protein AABX48_04325 [Nanoarchaeota archaeon]
MKIRDISLLKYKKELTKDFLHKEYIKNKKSISRLQKELNIDWSTIKYYLNLYKILLRNHKEQASISSPGGKYLYNNLFTKDYLLKEYIGNKKGIKDLSDINHVDWGTVRRYLIRYKINVRSNKEQKLISNPPKEFTINNLSKSFIDGLVLGDASIPKRKDGIKSRAFTQACKHEEYLYYVKDRLFNFGITSSPILIRWIKDNRCKNKGYNQNFLQTHRYRTFEEFRERWYKNGKKIIPQDLILTPDLLLQAYLCDGNFYREIRLCLDAFNIEDILFLKRLIKEELDIETRVVKSKDQFELAIKKSDTPKFLEYIGTCPVKCYQYKWKDNESVEAKERKRINAKLKYHQNKNGRS